VIEVRNTATSLLERPMRPGWPSCVRPGLPSLSILSALAILSGWVGRPGRTILAEHRLDEPRAPGEQFLVAQQRGAGRRG
jgi:hypothetical protein